MEALKERIVLSGAEFFVPQNAEDGYRVRSGSVLVYIVPWKNGAAGRRLLLCQAEQGRVIPSLVYQDHNYDQWRFCFVPGENAELQRLDGCVTSILLRRFAEYAGLRTFETEGFEQSVVEFYQRESLKDDVFLNRGRQREPKVRRASFGVIHQTFSDTPQTSGQTSPLYRAVAYACQRSSISIEPYAQLVARCGKDLTTASIAEASRFLCRRVVLEPDWYRSDCGPLIGTIDGEPVACVPRGSGYEIFFGSTGQRKQLTKELAGQVEPRAESLGRALPGGKLDKKGIARFCLKSISSRDLVGVILLGLAGTLLGVLLPILNQKIYDDYIPLGRNSQLVQLCMVICACLIGNLLFGIVKSLLEFRLQSRVGYELQNAVYHRLFRLPESFFRRYDSADLAQRLAGVSTMAGTVFQTLVLSGLAALFSVLYLVRMFQYSGKLAWTALGVLVVYGLSMYWLGMRTLRYEKAAAECNGEASSRLYQYLNGIEKIRMAGVEDQAIYEYLIPFSRKQREEISKNRIDGLRTSLSTVISSVFSMVLYFVMIRSKASITMGQFVAFNTAFGAFSAAILAWMNGMIQISQLKPTYARIRAVFEERPEDSSAQDIPGTLSGALSLDHVSFSYGDGERKILKDLTLRIREGEYLGIVGPSGCGKSTLLKLLLGFEQPQTGQILYDGHDLQRLDKRQLRKNLGVVLQNGKLIAGSIYENITITAPQASMREVQAVIEAVGLKNDIEQMPMGIHTVLSENSGTISGGQQQRILIARAIISHPSILIFDEATSALDNLTQAAVCESLDKMNVTRIVVAHRLSTIRKCDRIVVLDDGQIAEEGNFDSLMARKGLFYRLASRQLA